jgi:hypothetical protein
VPPLRRDRDRSGAQLKSLARQDLARRSTTMDELEYALEGLGRQAPPAVLQRCALDLVCVVAPELAASRSSSSFLSSCGGISALARGLRCVPSPDPLVGLSVACLLHAISDGDTTDATTSRHVVIGTIHRFQLATADLAPEGDSEPGGAETNRAGTGVAQGAAKAAAGARGVSRGTGAGGGGSSSGKGGNSANGGKNGGNGGKGGGSGPGANAPSLSGVELSELWSRLGSLSTVVAASGLRDMPAGDISVASQAAVRSICLEILVGRASRDARARTQVRLRVRRMRRWLPDGLVHNICPALPSPHVLLQSRPPLLPNPCPLSLMVLLGRLRCVLSMLCSRPQSAHPPTAARSDGSFIHMVLLGGMRCVLSMLCSLLREERWVQGRTALVSTPAPPCIASVAPSVYLPLLPPSSDGPSRRNAMRAVDALLPLSRRALGARPNGSRLRFP